MSVRIRNGWRFRQGSDTDSTHPPPGEVLWREGIVERALKHAFVCGADDCAQLASCLGPQGTECDLQQGADVVVAVAEVCVIAFVERLEVSAWPADRCVPAAERVCDFTRGGTVASFEGGDLPVCRGGQSAEAGRGWRVRRRGSWALISPGDRRGMNTSSRKTLGRPTLELVGDRDQVLRVGSSDRLLLGAGSGGGEAVGVCAVGRPPEEHPQADWRPRSTPGAGPDRPRGCPVWLPQPTRSSYHHAVTATAKEVRVGRAGTRQ